MGSDVHVIGSDTTNNILKNGKLTVEYHIKIQGSTGIKMEKLRSFDESTKEFSDVVLIVNDQKFYVLKTYLASHSSYFKSLFMGNFEESKNSEITLNNIDPHDFQNFLELIHGESEIEDDTVEGILHLADMYDSKTAIRRCEKFLVEKTKQPLKMKFEMAINYKLDQLKKKCLSELKTAEDIRSILPPKPDELEPSLLAALLNLSLSFQ